MTPSALASLSQAELQLSKASSMSDATRSSLLLSAQMSVTNSADIPLTAPGSATALLLVTVHNACYHILLNLNIT